MIKIPYGAGDITLNLPADVAETDLQHIQPVDLQIPAIEVSDVAQAIIIFTDATRHAPDQLFAEKILAALPLPAERVRFLCAIGMHRPSTHAEKIAKLGEAILNTYRVDDHDPAQVVNIGTIDGIPVEVNRALVEPNTLLISLGVVEPHQYAGYSGGAKTAVIGCGGAGTISKTHSVSMLDHPGVRLGVIEGNPFQQFVRQAGAMIGRNLIANAVLPAPDLIAAAGFGEVSLHDELVRQARHLYETPVPNAPYDVVIAGVGAPKDANLYQASRAATYIGLSGNPVLRTGGVIIVPATMPEGAGQGAGERNFYRLLERLHPSVALMDYLRQQDALPGEQRAYMIAQMLQKYHCIMVGAADPGSVTGAGLRYADTLEAALTEATAITGQAQPKILVVPHALQTLPVFTR